MRHVADLPLILCALCGSIAGCSEYEVKLHDESAPGRADTATAPYEPPEVTVDTAAPPVEPDCSDFTAPAVYTVATDEECIAEPSVGSFDPVVEWQWASNTIISGYDDIMAAPAVGNLTDDNGDGRIDEDDIPDIVFTSFSGGSYSSAGTVTAISGDGSGIHWSVSSVEGYGFYGSGGVAIGDIDADGTPEVCVAGYSTAVVCLTGNTAALEWAAGTETNAYGCPAMADMDGNGRSEVIFGRQIFDHRGNILGVGAYGWGGPHAMSFAVDWDGDGQLEVIAGNAAYTIDGTAIWTDPREDGAPAVGDFDLDGRPDVVRTSSGVVNVVTNGGTLLWATDLPGGGTGGAPTVADFDGDGLPEVGVADLSRYSVFDTDGSVLWSNTVSDYSSSQTGSSVFDFEGDGTAEVVYADEHTLWIFDGATGAIRMQQEGHASGTLFEYPLIADVDHDGATEIIVASNDYAYSGWNGISIIGDATNSWAPARPIWNQYAYHITNVNNDGTIPAVQTENWLTWNNFRAGGTELGPSHWLAQLGPGTPEICLDECGDDMAYAVIPIESRGLLDAEAFVVNVYRTASDGTRTVVHTETITALPAGDSIWIGPIAISHDDWGSARLFAWVDDGNAISECDEGDNVLDLGAWPCP